MPNVQQVAIGLQVKNQRANSRNWTVPLENLESYERMGVIFPFIILADAHVSHLLNSVPIVSEVSLPSPTSRRESLISVTYCRFECYGRKLLSLVS